jgi:hypothetical protein
MKKQIRQSLERPKEEISRFPVLRMLNPHSKEPVERSHIPLPISLKLFALRRLHFNYHATENRGLATSLSDKITTVPECPVIWKICGQMPCSV